MTFERLGIKAGNLKLGKDTAIINMGTAGACPSRRMGLCPVIKSSMRCYAEKAEAIYPSVIRYRKKQAVYWLNTSASTIISDIYTFIKKKNPAIKYLRFNESGDFFTQDDVDKLSEIADSLLVRGIITYGYTARYDLDYSNIKFLLKGSSFDAPNGITYVARRNPKHVSGAYRVCPMNCRNCNYCKLPNKLNIIFRYH
jgi:hypothetical protein